MFAKVRVIALVIGAGLVGMAPFANAQFTLVNQKFSEFKEASLGKQIQLGGETHQSGGVLGVIELQQTLMPSATAPDSPLLDEILEQRAKALDEAIERRDAAAKALADAITEAMKTMKTMNPNNQQDGKQLERIFDEIQLINKTTNDAVLRHKEAIAIANQCRMQKSMIREAGDRACP